MTTPTQPDRPAMSAYEQACAERCGHCKAGNPRVDHYGYDRHFLAADSSGESEHVPCMAPSVEQFMEEQAARIAELEAASLQAYLNAQWQWSAKTFGPGKRTLGIIDHITKELREVQADPSDLSEWIDIVILAMDGYWRHGGTPATLMSHLLEKQRKNFERTWPAPTSEDVAVEHVRDAPLCSTCTRKMVEMLDARIRRILALAETGYEGSAESTCFHLMEIKRILEGQPTCGVYDGHGEAGEQG